jgi:hypothetical protein
LDSKGYGRKWLCPDLSYYPDIFQDNGGNDEIPCVVILWVEISTQNFMNEGTEIQCK